MAGPLDRRTVVVTRPAGGPDALSDRLRELGAAVRALPAIELAPPRDLGPLDAALGSLEQFDWAAFASATAVERVLARLAALGLPAASLASRRLAAVGPATAARLAAALRAPDLVPPAATGAALADALAPAVRGRRVLLPRPADGRPELLDGLAAAGAEVTAVEAYCTEAVPPARLAPLRGWLEAGEVDAVTFASPSAVRAVLAALDPGGCRLLARTLLAAIGPTTADALRAAGLAHVLVPDLHTGPDLADAIARALAPG
ncbi:MAG TPA: uroporphyrinogen-III synthase [Anaeromyxobacter sp.]|nr:uroporphyrinogen-III synthase [Anaeromyxobacter sp.]